MSKYHVYATVSGGTKQLVATFVHEQTARRFVDREQRAYGSFLTLTLEETA